MDRVVLITGGTSDIANPLIDKILKKTEYKILISKYSSEINFSTERIIEYYADFSTLEGINNFVDKIKNYNIAYFIQLHGSAIDNDNIENQNFKNSMFLLNINILSINMILEKVLNNMKLANFGRITLISTASANYGGGKNSFYYGLSKHSVSYVIKHLAKFYSEFGILSNAISPGFINTKFHTKIMKREDKFLEERKKSVRVGYHGTPQDIANIVFEITFNNNFISGENIKIDGADFI